MQNVVGKIAEILNEKRAEFSGDRVFKEIDAFINRYNMINLELAKKLDTRHHINSNDLTQILKDNRVDDIIVYVTSADHYIVFKTNEEYKNFINGILDDGIFNEKDLVRYQILLTDQKQKVIFKYHNNIDEKLLRQYVKECFDKEVIITYNEKSESHQVMIDIKIDKFEDGIPMFDRLHNYIATKNQHIANSISPIRPFIEKETNKSYIAIPLLDKIKFDDDITRYLGNINININIIHNGDVINGNVINNNIVNNNNLDDPVRDWISNNPPVENMSAGNYYDRYKQAHQNTKTKSIQKFSDLVKNSGYDQKRKGTVRVWVKI